MYFIQLRNQHTCVLNDHSGFELSKDGLTFKLVFFLMFHRRFVDVTQFRCVKFW
jgi:hypothetical protein